MGTTLKTRLRELPSGTAGDVLAGHQKPDDARDAGRGPDISDGPGDRSRADAPGRARALGRADAGHEAVGQALLITGVATGALAAVQLSHIVIDACQIMISALS